MLIREEERGKTNNNNNTFVVMKEMTKNSRGLTMDAAKIGEAFELIHSPAQPLYKLTASIARNRLNHFGNFTGKFVHSSNAFGCCYERGHYKVFRLMRLYKGNRNSAIEVLDSALSLSIQPKCWNNIRNWLHFILHAVN